VALAALACPSPIPATTPFGISRISSGSSKRLRTAPISASLLDVSVFALRAAAAAERYSEGRA
jgi:hypothetical protein